MQEAPKVTNTEVEEMVRRDFPADQFQDVMLLLHQIKKEPEEARVKFQLEILKLSFGKIEFLRKAMPTAPGNAPNGGGVFVNQPVPKVTRKHVEKIVRRDYPTEEFSNVFAILDQYKGSNENTQARIHLAVLKLANGKLDELSKQVEDAKSDFRDVIAGAEYPNYHWDTFKLSHEEQEKIYSKDWQQYKDWFDKK